MWRVVLIGLVLAACTPSATNAWMSVGGLVLLLGCLLPRAAKSQANAMPGSNAKPGSDAKPGSPASEASDRDRDGVPDAQDNCPNTYNPDQRKDWRADPGDPTGCEVGPCLSPPPPPPRMGCGAPPGLTVAPPPDPEQVRARVLAQLPADVQARLTEV